jgi:hypothetical protein
MTKQAGKPRVITIVMFELREISRCWLAQHCMCENFFRNSLLVTRVAAWRQRRKLALLVVTGEAHSVSKRSRFGSFFALRLRVLMAVSAISV